jgi:hypothetical protein
MNVVPRGDMSHLYAWVTVTSKRDASNGSQPTACVASTIVIAPLAASASRSASVPSLDCAAEKATTSASCAASASRSSGTTRASARTRNGHSSDVKSPSGTTTLAPAGSDAATVPRKPATVAPIATSAAGTPTRRANDARASSADAAQPSQLVEPPRHSPSACCSASHAGRGGSPYEAVFR